MITSTSSYFFFFFNDTATTEIYTLSLHDALPISSGDLDALGFLGRRKYLSGGRVGREQAAHRDRDRQCQKQSIHGQTQIGRATSELQSQSNLVCRLLLEKKKKK